MHDLTVPKWLYRSPPSYYLSRADELCLFSLPWLSVSPSPRFLISQMATTASLILQRSHFTRNKCILLFTDLVIYALCGFSHPFQFILPAFYECVCQRLYVCGDADEFTSIRTCAMCPCSNHSFWAEQKSMIAFSPWCCLTLLFHALYAISCYLETQLSIISIMAGKLQSAFDLLLIFFLLVTLKWVEIQRSRNYRMTWFFFFFRVCVWQWSAILAMKVSWRVSRNVFSSS